MFDKENLETEDTSADSESGTVTDQEVAEKATDEPQLAPKPVQQETLAERNFKALVEKNRRLERERDEAVLLAQEKVVQKEQQQEEPEFEIHLGEDEIAEGKHLRAVAKELKSMKDKLKQYEQKSTLMNEETMLKAKYPDIDKVVCKDNINMLREQDPEFAQLLDTSNNFSAKVISAYKRIKSMGIYVDDTYQSDRELAQRNAAKPKPLASVSPQQGDSPLSRANAFANGLTPELKQQLLREMEEARKSR